jgi:uncharacterized protein
VPAVFSVTILLLTTLISPIVHTQAPTPPALTQPVNDFAHVIDGASAAEMDRLIRALQTKTGDTVVVATVQSLEGYAGIEELAVRMFENGGRGVGAKGKDNGVLIVVALQERDVRIEVGYDLEQWITDGYAGETIREFMAPAFRQQQYGQGLLAATSRIIGRIAQARGVSIEGVQAVRERRGRSEGIPFWLIIVIFILFALLSRGAGGRGRRSRYWGSRGWSGWSSGVGPFGGGWSSGGGGGFGGGFGGFGGGRSGGGGASGGW